MLNRIVVIALCAAGTLPAQVVRGVIADQATGRPVEAATVALLAARDSVVAVAASDDSGRYRLTAPRPGSYRVAVRRLGWRPRSDGPFDLPDGATRTHDVAVERVPSELDTIRVSAKPGFFGPRRGSGVFALHARTTKGLFISAREIEWSGLPILEYLGRLPGFRTVPRIPAGQYGIPGFGLGAALQAERSREGCVRMRVDRVGFVEAVDARQLIVRPPPRAGYRVRPEYYVSLDDVVALEVYRNHDEGPPEWKMDMPNCAYIQAWTSRAW